MMSTARRFPIAVAGWLALAAAALAGPTGVKDDARLFKPDTVRTVNEQLAELRERFGIEVFIETVEALSVEQLKQLKERKDPAARRRFFAAWAEQQARTVRAEGVCVRICKNPPRTEVVVGAEVAEELFNRKNADRLASLLGGRHFEKHPGDADLSKAVAYVRDSLDAATRPVVWPWVLGIVLTVLAAWVAIALLRARDQAGNAPDHNRVPGALPGGAIGAAGGLGLYQSLRDRKNPPTTGPVENRDPTDSVEEAGDYADAEDPGRTDRSRD